MHWKLLWLLVPLGACLPHTDYTPRRPGVAALAIKGGKLAVVKDGHVASLDGAPALVACDATAAADLKRSHRLLRSSERNASIGGALNALTVLFPPAPALAAFFIIKAAGQEQRGTAALVDAVNHHNDAPSCVAIQHPSGAPGAPGAAR